MRDIGASYAFESGGVDAGATDARDRDIGVARLMPDGSRDTTFGTNGLVTLDLSTGAVDGTSYTADNVWSMAMYPDGRLVLCGSVKRPAGTDSHFATVRPPVDGPRDTPFATNGVYTLDIDNPSGTPRTSSILPDGSIISTGYMSESNKGLGFRRPRRAPGRSFDAAGAGRTPSTTAAARQRGINGGGSTAGPARPIRRA